MLEETTVPLNCDGFIKIHKDINNKTLKVEIPKEVSTINSKVHNTVIKVGPNFPSACRSALDSVQDNL